MRSSVVVLHLYSIDEKASIKQYHFSCNLTPYVTYMKVKRTVYSFQPLPFFYQVQHHITVTLADYFLVLLCD